MGRKARVDDPRVFDSIIQDDRRAAGETVSVRSPDAEPSRIRGEQDVVMSASVARALKLAGALAAGSVLVWLAMEWWVTRSDDILVVEKGSASSQPMVGRFIVSDAGQAFMVGISTLGSEDRNALWEKLKPGCRYSIRYIDQSRYPVPSGKSGMSGYFIANASTLDCPGLPTEPVEKAPSAEELLDRLTGARKARQP